ncbi:MAG TPA: MBL fold metallo-hydrolase [Egibacteraceae bacterium]
MKPPPPLFSHPPLPIADDTWLIRHLHETASGPLPVSSLLVLGAQPTIVDTGARCNREQWLADVLGLVDPGDVRWVVVSHDHADHDGNLEAVLDACPRATLVISRALLPRLALRVAVPGERCLLVDDASRSTPATAASWRCGHRCTTAPPRAASSTAPPACTGRSTPGGR